jgi:hypothetical protein
VADAEGCGSGILPVIASEPHELVTERARVLEQGERALTDTGSAAEHPQSRIAANETGGNRAGEVQRRDE